MILKGDCIEVMKAMKPNSVDAIVCDPPYGLEFMGKKWDKLMRKDRKVAYPSCRSGHGPDAYQAGLEMQLWHTQWLTEAYQVLKPGGSMLVMGGTRTSHRLACAIEDSGFIIKDTLMWIYGSGFPKAQDLGKMIDKRGGRFLKALTEFVKYVKECRDKKGLTNKEIDVHLGLSSNGATASHYTCINGEQPRFPRLEFYPKLKELLNMDNRFDEIVKEAEREKIGKDKHWGQAGNSIGIGGQEWDLSLASTDLAKHWDGFKVGGIKPAYEPIIWAVKPPGGSYVDNVLKHGVGAVNVDECRIGFDDNIDKDKAMFSDGDKSNYKQIGEHKWGYALPKRLGTNPKGRFPANVILSHHPECVQVGMKKVKNQGGVPDRDSVKNSKPAFTSKEHTSTIHHFEKDGSETVESWDCHPDCAVRMLDEQSGNCRSAGNYPQNERVNKIFNSKTKNVSQYNFYSDNGGASRFFYCAKASRGERNAGLQDLAYQTIDIAGQNTPEAREKRGRHPRHIPPVKNNHPTVKPIKLFEYLIKLVTRQEQIVLDPFIGSGTTAIAAHNTGRKCVGIEKEDEYLTIAKRRIDYWKNQPQQLALGR